MHETRGHANGGDPQVILSIGNDPIFEAMGVQPCPPEEELDCRETSS